MKVCIKSWIAVSFLIAIFFNTSYAQLEHKKEIDSIKSIDFKQLQESAYKIANSKGWLVKEVLPDGTVVKLQYIDRFGDPVYLKTDNIKAAITTNTNTLQPNGSLGMNLSGTGMTVGIWDGGAVRVSHVELKGKTNQLDNPSDLDGHATHVAGTILAKGVNPNAIGMAPEALAVTYDFNGDISEMTKEAEKGLLLSNHSYGQQLGWAYGNNGWVWLGDKEISSLEDYRFGLYDNLSRSFDLIAFQNPFYLIVKSSGNDRSDFGSGTSPSDGPYDILGPRSVAKNVLTVGAVNPVLEYKDPMDVIMSSFSSWGPTDDGRIKPDIVADGVNVFSSSSTGDTDYSSLSGTSMSAPNVTGSLVLLQELYNKKYHHYMLSSTLKGLIIHTAREAGNADGPDYQFGWGLLDTEAAAKLILLSDQEEFLINKDTLRNGEIYVHDIYANSGEMFTTTISWTDVPGAPTNEKVLDPKDLKLINDLDVRVYGPDGTEIKPWIINPETKNVSKGDNFRDNVEKIEFKTTVSGNYRIEVSHKYQLAGNEQTFSMIASTRSIQNQLKSFYYTFENNDLSDINNWSESKGGDVASRLPGANDIVIFDGFDFEQENNVITVTGGKSTFAGISVRNLAELSIDIPMEVSKYITVVNSNLTIKGAVSISEMASVFIESDNSNVKFQKLILDDHSTQLKIDGVVTIDSLYIYGGYFRTLDNLNSTYINLRATSPSVVDFSGVEINNFSTFLNDSDHLILKDDNTQYTTASEGTTSIFNNKKLNDLNVLSTKVVFVGNGEYRKAILPNSTVINGNIFIKSLNLENSTSIFFENKSSLEFDSIVGGNGIEIIDDGGDASTIISNTILKHCFLDALISGVNANGSTKLVVDPLMSQVNNASGWIIDECSDVLTAIFVYEYACAKGITTFYDKSEGDPVSWEWSVDGEIVGNDSILNYSFNSAGQYTVSLKVSNSNDESTLTTNINVTSSSLGVPQIIKDNNVLRSTAFATNYQWFYNNDSIEGANSFQIMDFVQPGSYSIHIWNTNCKMFSDPFFIAVTGVSDTRSENKSIHLYPNPVVDVLSITGVKTFQYKLLDASGQFVSGSEFLGDKEVQIDLSNLVPGFYILFIEDNKGTVFSRKIIKK